MDKGKAPMQCVPWGCGGIRRIGFGGGPWHSRICKVHCSSIIIDSTVIRWDASRRSSVSLEAPLPSGTGIGSLLDWVPCCGRWRSLGQGEPFAFDLVPSAFCLLPCGLRDGMQDGGDKYWVKGMD